MLGFSNLFDPGIPYWEPKEAGESKAEHNSRRQRECEEMDHFIAERLAGRSINDISAQEETVIAESLMLQEQLTRSEARYKGVTKELEPEKSYRLAAESELAKTKQ